jgi:hypothetical protein
LEGVLQPPQAAVSNGRKMDIFNENFFSALRIFQNIEPNKRLNHCGFFKVYNFQ